MIVGGASDQEFLTNSEVYDPTSDMWRSKGRLNKPRFVHTTTLLPDGKVLLAGGSTGLDDALPKAELYDPAIENWVTTGDLQFPRATHTATLLADGRVLVAGGVVCWIKSHRHRGIVRSALPANLR